MSNLVSSDRSGTQRLFYDRPAETWLEALPLGNGRIGAMCFGGIGRDRIGLNDETLWSGSPETARSLSTPLGATGADAVQALRDALTAGDIRQEGFALSPYGGLGGQLVGQIAQHVGEDLDVFVEAGAGQDLGRDGRAAGDAIVEALLLDGAGDGWVEAAGPAVTGQGGGGQSGGLGGGEHGGQREGADEQGAGERE